MTEEKNGSATMPETVDFTISRIFNAPRDLVWEVYTKAEHMKHWWGPKGFTMKVCNLDFRPEGVFHYCMTAPNGDDMWGKFVYKEIFPKEKITFINYFSDENGNPTRHPMAPTWPLEVFNIMTLTENDGKTTVTLSGGPHNASDEEVKTFAGAHKSMEQGFKGTLDNLDEYLASLQS